MDSWEFVEFLWHAAYGISRFCCRHMKVARLLRRRKWVSKFHKKQTRQVLYMYPNILGAFLGGRLFNTCIWRTILVWINFSANGRANLESVAMKTQKKESFYTSELHVSLSVAQKLLTSSCEVPGIFVWSWPITKFCRHYNTNSQLDSTIIILLIISISSTCFGQ